MAWLLLGLGVVVVSAGLTMWWLAVRTARRVRVEAISTYASGETRGRVVPLSVYLVSCLGGVLICAGFALSVTG
jgi:hypothetical protein